MGKNEFVKQVSLRDKEGHELDINSSGELSVNVISGGGGGSTNTEVVQLNSLEQSYIATQTVGSDTSSYFETGGKTKFRLQGKIEKTGTPGRIQFKIYTSETTTLAEGAQVEEWYWQQASYAAAGVNNIRIFSLVGDCVAPSMAVHATAVSNTSASYFELSDMKIYLL